LTLIQDNKDVNLSHIKDECMKKEVECLKVYKKKEKDVNIR